jgi:hypothetical protein
MRRRYGQPTFPTLYFKEGVLSVPGYTFEKASRRSLTTSESDGDVQAVPWHDTGSMTDLAEGNSLKDGSNVLAKIAPSHSNGSMCLEREAHLYVKISLQMSTSLLV